jgi:hypothetical protein
MNHIATILIGLAKANKEDEWKEVTVRTKSGDDITGSLLHWYWEREEDICCITTRNKWTHYVLISEIESIAVA